MEKKLLTLGHSPDPDDAFMFYGLNIENGVDTNGYEFEQILKDIQTLNEMAIEEKLDITAISLAAYPTISDKYAILSSGASMGYKYGPLIVAKEKFELEELKKKLIAIPGKLTSAYLELRLLLGKDLTVEVIPFDKIFDAVLNGDVDAGLIIHEGQLTYSNYKLEKIVDLGVWWYEKTKLPLPLGVNAIHRKFGEEMKNISNILRESILFSLNHREEAVKYALNFARGMDKNLADKFVGMYVNELTVDMGENGLKACRLLLKEAYDKGLIDKLPEIDLV
ncbi:MqnA/MqnD/SBP family protein [Hippea alviniae]|uniref:MqnA/MqnD/SBP family protein n=1 Tax=Hippea alviniae TaxID=1279027 RepID=UPI0003B49A53|nr:MqnA/MqnD/SBP family protein [Hippea alviniae]